MLSPRDLLGGIGEDLPHPGKRPLVAEADREVAGSIPDRLVRAVQELLGYLSPAVRHGDLHPVLECLGHLLENHPTRRRLGALEQLDHGPETAHVRRRPSHDEAANLRELRLRDEAHRPSRRARHERLDTVPDHQRDVGIVSVLFVPEEPLRDGPSLLVGQALQPRGEVEADHRRGVLPGHRDEALVDPGRGLPVLQAELDGPGADVGMGAAQELQREGLADSARHVERPERPELPRNLGIGLQDLSEHRPRSVVEAPLRRAVLEDAAGGPYVPVVFPKLELHERFVGPLAEVHIRRLVVLVDHLVDAAVGAVGRPLLVTRLLVVPVDEVGLAVRPIPEVDRPKPLVLGEEEVRVVLAHVAGALPDEAIVVDAVAADVPHEEGVAILLRPVPAEVDHRAAVGVAAARVLGLHAHLAHAPREVAMVGHGRDALIHMGIEVLARLAAEAGALNHVEEVGDHTDRTHRLAVVVEVDAPGVGRPPREDLEGVLHRVVAPVARVDWRPLLLGRARLPDAGVGEHALAAVEPSVGSPDEPVEGLVGVLMAPAREDGAGLAVGLVVAVLVRDEQKVRRRAHPNPAEAHLQTADEVEAVAEDLSLVELPVARGVLEDEDAVVALGGPVGILEVLGHPEPPVVVVGHRDGLAYPRLGGGHLHPEALRQVHGLRRLLRGPPHREHARLVGPEPLVAGDLLPLVHVDEGALLVPDHDVRSAVARDVARDHLGSHARVVVHRPRDELHALVRALEAEPVEHRGLVAARVVAVVGPPPLARDDVLEAVAVDVGHVHRVGLAERHAVAILVGVLPDDLVAAERDLAFLPDVLEPREAVSVGVQGGDDVVVAVAVDVVGVHLGAPRLGEAVGVVVPNGVPLERRGLLPPPLLLEKVGPAVAVHVAHAEAVGELPASDVLRDRVEGPRLPRLVRVHRGVAEAVVVLADEIGLAVAGDVREGGRLVVHAAEGDVLVPVARVRLARVLVPASRLPGKPDHEDVRPAVPVDVVGEREKVVGVALHLEGLRRVVGVSLLERGPLVPVGTRDEVRVAVLVEVREVGALAVELLRELTGLEGVEGALLRLGRRRDRGNGSEGHGTGKRGEAGKPHGWILEQHSVGPHGPMA